MAPKGTKTNVRLERIMEPRHSRQPHRKRSDIPRRLQLQQSIDLPELLLKLLKAENHSQESKRKDDFKWSNNIAARYRNVERALREKKDVLKDSKSSRESECSIEMIDVANRSGSSSSCSSRVSNIPLKLMALENDIGKKRSILKKKTVVELINSYIKAGIEEGKRQAKKYIWSALCFGLRSGYLIPADSQGQGIRVSNSLLESAQANSEMRKKRRRARKGEEEPDNTYPKYLREAGTWTMETKCEEATPTNVGIENKRTRKRKRSRSSIGRSNSRSGKTKSGKMTLNLKEFASKTKVPKKRARKLPGNKQKGDQKKPSRKRSTPRRRFRKVKLTKRRDRVTEIPEKIEIKGNDTNQKTVTGRRRSASRSKSRPKQNDKKTKSSYGNLKEEEIFVEPSCSCEDCQNDKKNI